MTQNRVIKNFLILILSLGICLFIGYIGGYPELSKTSIGVNIDLHISSYIGGYPGLLAGAMPPFSDWYVSLIKPIFSPPSWIFSPAWIVSFVLMGLTLFMILQSGLNQRDVALGLILFVGQLIFTLAWAFAFFGLHAVFIAFMCIIALWATLLCTVIQVFRFSVYGGMLLIPYFLWICYLAYLNYGIMVLNNFVFVF